MKKLASDHTKATEGFKADWTKAEGEASANRIRAEQDTARSIAKIYSDLSTRLSDMAEDESDNKSQSEHDWLIKSASYAKDRAKIESDLADELKNISADAADKEQTAKTYAEVMRIRKDEQAREAEAQKKAGQQRTDLSDKQRSDLEDYNYRQDLAEKESIKSAQRARRDADTQAAEQRAQLQRQEADIAAKLATEKTAIEEKAKAEAAAYAQSTKDATTAHNKQIKELTDTRTEAQKYLDDWDKVKNKIDDTTASLIIQSGVLGSMGASNYSNGWVPGIFKGGHASGGAANAGSAYLVGERGPEILVMGSSSGNIIPNNQLAGGTTVHVYIDGQEFRGMIRTEVDKGDRGVS